MSSRRNTSSRASSTRRSSQPWPRRWHGRLSRPGWLRADVAPRFPPVSDRVRATMGLGGEIRWSVVIPAYDEEERLPQYLHEVVAFFEELREPYEVIVVDDGSRDSTRERVRELQAIH